MPRSTPILLALAAGIAACDMPLDILGALSAELEQPASDWQVHPDEPPPPEGQGAPIAPQVGQWAYDELSEGVGACSAALGLLGLDQADRYFVTDTDVYGFKLWLPELQADLSCTLEPDASWTCGALSGTMVLDAIDATLDVVFSSSGQLVDETESTGTFSAEVACAGEDCDIAAAALSSTLPCGVQLKWRAMHGVAT